MFDFSSKNNLDDAIKAIGADRKVSFKLHGVTFSFSPDANAVTPQTLVDAVRANGEPIRLKLPACNIPSLEKVSNSLTMPAFAVSQGLANSINACGGSVIVPADPKTDAKPKK